MKRNRPNETLFQVTAAALVQAVWVKASAVGRVHKGTYNRQDPTAFCNVTCYLSYEMDPYLMKDYWSKYQPTEEELKECPLEMFTNSPPPEACYKLEMYDCTWGVEVRLTFVDSEIEDEKQDAFLSDHPSDKEICDPHGRNQQVLNFYLDHDSGEVRWAAAQMEKVETFLLDCICGDVGFLNEPIRYEKDMTEEELETKRLHAELEAWDAAMRRNCE